MVFWISRKNRVKKKPAIESRHVHEQESEDEVRKRLARKVPAKLLDDAIAGLYPRINPYPIESLQGHFSATPFVTREKKLVTLGSCFAQRVAEWLVSNNFNCLNAPWGVVYNPLSIYQIAQYSLDTENWNPDQVLWKTSEGYGDPYRKSDDHSGPMFLGDSHDTAMLSLKNHYESSREAFTTADVFVFTYGLTECFRNKVDKRAFFSMPLNEWYDEEKHEFHNLEYQEIVESISGTISLIRKHNPKSQFILSVSPVPLSISFRKHLGPYVATQFSKSVLHAALYEVTQNFENVFYMPSLEMTRIDPVSCFQPDGRHVRKEAVEEIMSVFSKLYVAE